MFKAAVRISDESRLGTAWVRLAPRPDVSGSYLCDPAERDKLTPGGSLSLSTPESLASSPLLSWVLLRAAEHRRRRGIDKREDMGRSLVPAFAGRPPVASLWELSCVGSLGKMLGKVDMIALASVCQESWDCCGCRCGAALQLSWRSRNSMSSPSAAAPWLASTFARVMPGPMCTVGDSPRTGSNVRDGDYGAGSLFLSNIHTSLDITGIDEHHFQATFLSATEALRRDQSPSCLSHQRRSRTEIRRPQSTL